MAHQAPQRTLGTNGPQVPALGFGTMGLSILYTSRPQLDEERLQVLDTAHSLGATHWDSADMYGDSEELLGRWFRRTGKRNEIFLATKFGNVVVDGQRLIRNEPGYVKAACARSLQRLGVDQIDLYYCHRFNGQVPVEDIVGAMKELVEEGKVKHIGLSECSAATLRRAHAVHPIAAVQIEYSPWTMNIEDPQIALLQTCRELGVATVAYSPLGRGFLTGQYRSLDDLAADDVRRVHPRFSRENFPKNLQLVDRIRTIANRKGCTPGQLTLAWLLSQGEDIIPIPGTKRVAMLEENWGALTVTISPKEEREIREAIAASQVHGTRYPEAHMGNVFVDTPLPGAKVDV